MTPPLLPSPIKGISVRRDNGAKAHVVSLKDAAKLMGLNREHIKRWVKTGKVEMCIDPRGNHLVFVESLWGMVPEEFRR